MSKTLQIAGLAILIGGGAAAGERPLYACQGRNLQFGEMPLCSKTFHAHGKCDGHDQLATLWDTDNWPRHQYVTPWEEFPIIIRGVSINFIGGPTPLYVLAGNSFAPDVMAELGGGNRHMRTPITERFGFPFPAKGDGGDKFHIDLHVACPAGSDFDAMYTIYYTPNPGMGAPPR